MKNVKSTNKTNKSNMSNKTVKVYDTISHRSYSFKANEVNIAKTRKNPGQIFIHKWADPTSKKLPYKFGELEVGLKTWNKFARGHRNEW